jgi:hypothetical protein
LTVTSTPRVTTLVLNAPLGDRVAGAAVDDDLELLGATDVEVVGDEASKNARACRGAANTRVRETSTWRREISHQ